MRGPRCGLYYVAEALTALSNALEDMRVRERYRDAGGTFRDTPGHHSMETMRHAIERMQTHLSSCEKCEEP